MARRSRGRPERDVQLLALAAANEGDLDGLVRAIGEHAAQRVGPRDLLAVDLDEDVADEDAGRRGRAAVLEAGDERALPGRIRTDAEVALANRAVLQELGDHAAERLD